MVNADPEVVAEERPIENALRGINPRRRRYTDDQINFIRESYLLDRKDLAWIRSQLEPQLSRAATWRIAVGRTYADVPLTERLLEAHQHSRVLRERSAAQIAALSGRPAVPAAAEVAADVDELFEPADVEPAEDWA